ncbi:MAG TPA: hypothetical protein VK761_10375 [Solirubrobacteraceae bacterium]|jgi:hypothetical protein|nr:hypothetical protein [Solirubrobacteraceae bacterium]
MSKSIEQLSLELTWRSLDEQERYLSSLRSGAGTVLGAASIAASLLATHIGRSSNAWAVPAMISYGLCFASALWVLLPRDFLVSLGGSELISEDDDAVADVGSAYRATVRWSKPSLIRNRRTIGRLADWLTLSCLLLTAEIVSCVISLAS